MDGEFLYHVTAQANIPAILVSRRLKSAATLVEESALRDREREATLSDVRTATLPIPVRAGAPANILNDQVRLLAFRKCPGIGAYVRFLNEHVFFWGQCPIATYSPRRVDRNRSVRAAVCFAKRFDPRPPCSKYALLQVDYEQAASSSQGRGPLFSAINTGAPDRVIAGARTDMSSLVGDLFTASREEAVEVVFRKYVDLPETSALWSPRDEAWVPLFGMESGESTNSM